MIFSNNEFYKFKLNNARKEIKIKKVIVICWPIEDSNFRRLNKNNWCKNRCLITIMRYLHICILYNPSIYYSIPLCRQFNQINSIHS